MGGSGVISTEGSLPEDTPTEAQLQYLDTVCTTTQASIDYALAELPPRPTEMVSFGWLCWVMLFCYHYHQYLILFTLATCAYDETANIHPEWCAHRLTNPNTL